MGSLEALRRMLRQSHHAGPEKLPEMAMRAAPVVGASTMVIYLVDHQQQVLVPLAGGPERTAIAVDGTLGGRHAGQNDTEAEDGRRGACGPSCAADRPQGTCVHECVSFGQPMGRLRYEASVFPPPTCRATVEA